MTFRFSVLIHCVIIVCLYYPAIHDIFHTPMARYSLFVLKVPLNTNQPSDTTYRHNI